jgi:hypothetical protein
LRTGKSPFLIGKLSWFIYKWAIFHSYVTNNQRVTKNSSGFWGNYPAVSYFQTIVQGLCLNILLFGILSSALEWFISHHHGKSSCWIGKSVIHHTSTISMGHGFHINPLNGTA